jgi:hypothetical protein
MGGDEGRLGRWAYVPETVPTMKAKKIKTP